MGNRKSFSKLLLTSLFAVTALTACGTGGGVSEPGRDRKVSLSFLHIWPEHSKALTKIVNDYMALHPNVTINTQQSTHTDVTTYLTMQGLSGSYPDVFFYWTHQMNDIYGLDCALDLTPYAEGWKETFINNGEAWDLAKIDGKYYNVPFRSTGYVIVYNKTLFDDLKLTEPKSIEELENVLSTLRKYNVNQSFSPLALSGITESTLPQLITAFDSFVNLQNKTYTDPTYSSGLYKPTDFDNQCNAKVLDKLRDWNNKYYFGYAEGKREASCISDFVNMNAAMVLMNNNNLSLLEEIPSDVEIGMIAIPAPAELNGYTYVYGGYDGFSVSKYTKNADEAVKFLKYLTSPEVQSQFGNSENSIMAVKDIVYEEPLLNQMNVALTDVGNPLLKQNDVDYSLGDVGSSINSIKLNYVLGKSNKTALTIIEETNQMIEKQLKGYGITLKDRTVAYPDADFSWLDIRDI